MLLIPLALIVWSSSASAQLFGHSQRCCPPCTQDCAPCQPAVTPATPTTPSTPTTPTTPPSTEPTTTTPQTPQEAPELPNLAAGSQGRGVALAANNFGDAFLNRCFMLNVSVPGTTLQSLLNPPAPPSPPSPPSTFQPPSTTTPPRTTLNLGCLAVDPVGRTKLSDDNSPLPRDRVIFDYDFFSRTPLGPGGQDVHRFSPGIEKTFFDQRASLEVRFPFAATIDSDQDVGMFGSSHDAQFGNIHLTLKGLAYRDPVFNIAAGLGIDVPTADDARVSFNGRELVRVHNDEVVLTPFIAYLVTPNDRLFFQNWFAVDIVTNSNEVTADPIFNGLTNVGRLRDQNVLQIDAQLGYWLYRSEQSGWLTALAPFLELHYNSSVNDPGSVQFGPVSLAPSSKHFDELNMSVGVVAQVGENATFYLGAVFPLKEDTNRSFDYQLGLRANIFFGPTARDRSRATAISGF
jgi:hypothetical protein